MKKEIFQQLNAYIKDKKNFDNDQFVTLLQEAKQDEGFDIDYISNTAHEIKAHKKLKKWIKIEENLLDLAIRVANLEATITLITMQADIFNVCKKWIVTKSYDGNNKLEIQSRHPEKQKCAIELFSDHFGERALHKYSASIMAGCLEHFKSKKYGDKEFDFLATLGWWDSLYLTDLFNVNRGLLGKIFSYLEKRELSTDFLLDLVLADCYGENIDYQEAKAQVLEELKQEPPGLDENIFHWLLKLGLFNFEERNSIRNYYEKTATLSNTGLSKEEYQEILEDHLAYHNRFYARLLNYEQSLMDKDMAWYKKEILENRPMQKSDNELPLTSLGDEAFPLSNKLDKLAEKLESISKQLQEYAPKDQYTFNDLSIEFHVLHKLLAKKLKKYRKKREELLRINSEYEQGGVEDLAVSPPLDENELLKYDKKIEWAEELIRQEKQINGISYFSYCDIYTEDTSQEVSPTKKAKLTHPTKRPAQKPVVSEYRAQEYVNVKFFRLKPKMHSKIDKMDPSPPEKPSNKLYVQMKTIVRQGHNTPINLEGYASRSVIIALVRILKDYKKFPEGLRFKIGETVLSLSSNPTLKQIGNAKIEVMNKIDLSSGIISVASAYKDSSIVKYLNYLTKRDPRREKHLAKLMAERSKKISGFTENDFTFGQIIRLPGEEPLPKSNVRDNQYWWLKYKIHFLNQLNFLRSIFEVVRKLYRDDKGNVFSYRNAFSKQADSLPIANAQARTSALLQKGAIRMQDAYGNSIVDESIKMRSLSGEIAKYNYDTDKDRALFGAATGSFSSETDVALAAHKIKIINQKYGKTFFGEQNQSQRDIAKTCYEEMVSEFGSGSESSDDESDYDVEKALAFKGL